jgi:hypothetical protein
MELLARTTSRFLLRYRYGLWAYWFINAALVIAEIKWHVLYRLTIWDITTLSTIVGHPYHAGIASLVR